MEILTRAISIHEDPRPTTGKRTRDDLYPDASLMPISMKRTVSLPATRNFPSSSKNPDALNQDAADVDWRTNLSSEVCSFFLLSFPPARI